MNICLIPARGGSKRIPKKNIRVFHGKPMIGWSIEAAKKTGCFDRIIVSTDDEEVAETSRVLGAEVPFKRPKEISDDFSTTKSVVEHTIDWLYSNKIYPDRICCLYATAPFVRAGDILEGLDLLQKTKNAHFVFSGTNYSSPIQRAMVIDKEKGLAKMISPENYNKRSQDLDICYHDAGQFYWGRPETWKATNNMFDNSKLVILKNYLVQDIDTEEDWIRAEIMHKSIKDLL